MLGKAQSFSTSSVSLHSRSVSVHSLAFAEGLHISVFAYTDPATGGGWLDEPDKWPQHR